MFLPEQLIDSVFREFAILLLLTAVAGAAALRLHQPLILAYIVVGILAGPGVFGWVRAHHEIDLLAKIGISLLLFVVGLKLDLHLIRTMGSVALATGLGQVAFTSIIGFFITLWLGFDAITSLYVAVALTFSSTIIIVKLLSDKGEIDALHGRIALGFLIVQDLVVVFALIGLSALGTGGGDVSIIGRIVAIILKGGVFLGMIVLFMRYALPSLLARLVRSAEMMVLFAITWAVALAATADLLGFSMEVGAFLAGVSLASTQYRDAIGARLTSLRDFLLIFFFIDLGAGLELSRLGAQLWPAVVLSLFVLVGNPLIVMIIMGAMGYRKRTGFLAGLTVAQISEFSLILGAMGVTLGHISGDALGLITLVGLVTIGLSTYLILYSHPIYDRLAPWLSPFERRVPHREQSGDSLLPKDADIDCIVFGLGRHGGPLVMALTHRGRRVLGIDFDPQAVSKWSELGLQTQYGDVEDAELPAQLPLANVCWAISAMPGLDINRTLLCNLRDHGFSGQIALTAHHAHEVSLLEQAGADLVLMPFADAADRAAERLMGCERRTAT